MRTLSTQIDNQYCSRCRGLRYPVTQRDALWYIKWLFPLAAISNTSLLAFPCALEWPWVRSQMKNYTQGWLRCMNWLLREN